MSLLAIPHPTVSPSVQRARELVLRYGWNAMAYQILNPGIQRWFSADGEAVVGYASAHGCRVVAGAPVCASERLAEIADAFGPGSSRSAPRAALSRKAERKRGR